MSEPYNPDEAAVRNLLWGFRLLDETFAKLRQERAAKSKGMKCQYCGAATEGGYTCQECADTFPWRECKCENNGDYCESCEAWLRKRRGEVDNGIPV